MRNSGMAAARASDAGSCFPAVVDALDSAQNHRRLLAHGLDLAWSPALVEEGLQRAVEPQDDEPALFRVGLDPVARGDAVGLAGRDVHDGGAVRLGLRGG